MSYEGDVLAWEKRVRESSVSDFHKEALLRNGPTIEFSEGYRSRDAELASKDAEIERLMALAAAIVNFRGTMAL